MVLYASAVNRVATTSNIAFIKNHDSTMAEPTKQETEQVFKALRAHKGNKVRPPELRKIFIAPDLIFTVMF